MTAEANVNVNNLVKTIVQHPAFRETITSILTVTNQEQSCLLFRLKCWNTRGASHQPVFMCNCLTLITRVSLINLADELFLFLVQIKIIRRQREFKIPLCNSSTGKLLHRPSLSYDKAGSHLESCQTSCATSTMELFCKNT